MNQAQPTIPASPPVSQPAPNPLDQLKDIHLPEQIEQFQLAPGWWFLIALTSGLFIYFVVQWNRKRRSLYLLKPANLELNKIANAKPDNNAIAELSILMKRICLVYFPERQVAALSGESWVKFINQQVGKELFNEPQQKAFGQLTYQLNAQIDPNLWNDIINNARIAIDLIIRQGAKSQRKNRSQTRGQLI